MVAGEGQEEAAKVPGGPTNSQFHQAGGLRPPIQLHFRENLDSGSEDDLTGLSGFPDGESLVAIAAVEAAVPMEVDPAFRLQLPWAPEYVPRLTYMYMYAEIVAGLRVIDP